jgi:hypothetical protein
MRRQRVMRFGKAESQGTEPVLEQNYLKRGTD